MFGFATWWHVRENKQLSEYLARKKIDATTSEFLIKFAWSRTIQLLGAAAFGIIVIVAYDWKFNESTNLLYAINDVLEKQQAANEAKIIQQKEIQANQTTEQKTIYSIPRQGIQASENQPIPVQTYEPQPVLYTTAEPVILTTTQTSATAVPASDGQNTEAIDQIIEDSLTSDIPTEATQENTPSTLEQVYNPEREQSAQGNDQASMDDMKKRYEDILVIYMFLKQCGRIQSADYNVITSALSQEMASVNAPGRLQADIVSAAKGSYQEIYSQSPCEGAGINKLLRQYNQYIEVLKTNFPPQ